MVTSSTETQLVVDGNYNEKDCNQVDPAWKKAAIMLWKQIADHKYASIFMSPVRDEHAKSYSTVIKGMAFEESNKPKWVAVFLLRCLLKFRRIWQN